MIKKMIILALALTYLYCPTLMMAAGTERPPSPMMAELHAKLAQQKEKSEKAGPPARPPLHPKTPTAKKIPKMLPPQKAQPAQAEVKAQTAWAHEDLELQKYWEQIKALLKKYADKIQTNRKLDWWNLWSKDDYNDALPTLREKASLASVDANLFDEFMQEFLTEYGNMLPAQRPRFVERLDAVLPIIFGSEMIGNKQQEFVKHNIILMRQNVAPEPKQTIAAIEKVLKAGTATAGGTSSHQSKQAPRE